MFQPKEISVLDVGTTDLVRSTSVSPVKNHHDTMIKASCQDSTKDAGRVHIGGGMMRFHTTKDAGRVHVGGGMMRF